MTREDYRVESIDAFEDTHLKDYPVVWMLPWRVGEDMHNETKALTTLMNTLVGIAPIDKGLVMGLYIFMGNFNERSKYMRLVTHPWD